MCWLLTSAPLLCVGQWGAPLGIQQLVGQWRPIRSSRATRRRAPSLARPNSSITRNQPVLVRQTLPWLLMQVLLEVTTLPRQSHCGLAYKNAARDLKRAVLQDVKVSQAYNVAIPIRHNQTGLMKYEDHPALLPHEVIYYLVYSGRALVSDLAAMTSRMDHSLVNTQKQLCSDHKGGH